jgi:hypothetical protein
MERYSVVRNDGWFDLLVTGGGVVSLKFGKNPFSPRTRSLHVPANQVIFWSSRTNHSGQIT